MSQCAAHGLWHGRQQCPRLLGWQARRSSSTSLKLVSNQKWKDYSRQIKCLPTGNAGSSKIDRFRGTSDRRRMVSYPKHFSTNTAYASTTQHNDHNRNADQISNSNSNKAQGRGIIVTGGTSGIGFAVARRAILEGAAHVRIVTRDAQRGQAAIEQLRSATARSGESIELDCFEAETDAYGDSKLLQHTSSSPFTTIIHCAGITQTSLLTSTTHQAIQQLLQVNLESTALLSKSLLKQYMSTCIALNRQQPPPSSSTSPSSTTPPNPTWQIINISSLLAQKRGLGSSIYAATKAGVIALTRATALEGAEITKRYPNVAPGFRANVVVPGYIQTAMTKGISGHSRQKLLDDIPAGRFGTSDEVADAIMFLLGNEYANNCVLNLDGGLSAA